MRQTDAARTAQTARSHIEEYPAIHWMYHAANEGKCDPREAGGRQSIEVVDGISAFLTGAIRSIQRAVCGDETASQQTYIGTDCVHGLGGGAGIQNVRLLLTR